MITILAGGTGSVKIVRGFASKKHTDLKIISNVGDNIWLYGLYICPDIDTVLYGLAGMLANQGWGIKGDSFSFLNQMEKLKQETWFKIGDKDLATHIVRTNMLRNGRTLSEITDWMRKRYLISAKIFPVTDSQLETNIMTDQGEMHIQEFWVKHAGHPRVINVRYKGAKNATVNPDVIETIKCSDLIIIAPANPVSSINPILAVKGIKDQLMKHKERVVAISPLIGQRAISGPAVKYMRALKLMNSPLGVARFYSDFIGAFLIHSTDTALLSKIESFGIKVYATDIIMANFEDEIRLSSYIKRLQI
ncbi:MAG TPA: 2-phospho-L-lactate transferase [Nitrososphaeraceae archaeon]